METLLNSPTTFNTAFPVTHLPGSLHQMLKPRPRSAEEPYLLLTDKARNEIAYGSLPNLAQICHELNHTFQQNPAPHSALQFLPVLKNLDRIPEKEFEKLLNNPQTNHVLVQNVRMKVVLIRWEPGKQSSIHGHPKGGCVFKVLKGRLVEERYQPGETEVPLAKSTFGKGGMAYIDDVMAHHAVGNPFDEVSISLHVYTPGE